MGISVFYGGDFDSNNTSRIIKYTETDYTTLVANVTGQETGDLAETISSVGFGGVFGLGKSEGFYRWDGLSWVYKGKTLQDAISTNIDNISSNDQDIADIQTEQITQNNGIQSNSSSVTAIESEQITQNTAIALNTLKYSQSEVDDLILNRVIISTVTNSTTNVNNVDYTDTPVFGDNTILNDNGSFTNISPTQQRVNFDGWISINLNVAYTSNGQRAVPQGRIGINGIEVGALAGTGYIRSAAGNSQSSLHLSKMILLVSNGDLISFRVRRNSNQSSNITQLANQGQISIERLKTT